MLLFGNSAVFVLFLFQYEDIFPPNQHSFSLARITDSLPIGYLVQSTDYLPPSDKGQISQVFLLITTLITMVNKYLIYSSMQSSVYSINPIFLFSQPGLGIMLSFRKVYDCEINVDKCTEHFMIFPQEFSCQQCANYLNKKSFDTDRWKFQISSI